jgi:hypothetical protein
MMTYRSARPFSGGRMVTRILDMPDPFGLKFLGKYWEGIVYYNYLDSLAR